MTPGEAKALAQKAARENRLDNTYHAVKRCSDRDATNADIREAILNTKKVTPSKTNRGSWRFEGFADGERLHVYVGFDADGPVVVTHFWPDREE